MMMNVKELQRELHRLDKELCEVAYAVERLSIFMRLKNAPGWEPVQRAAWAMSSWRGLVQHLERGLRRLPEGALVQVSEEAANLLGELDREGA